MARAKPKTESELNPNAAEITPADVTNDNNIIQYEIDAQSDDVNEPEQIETDVQEILDDINETVDDLTGGTPDSTQNEIKKTAFEQNELIPCKSLYLGKLIYVSPTNGARYIWNEFGAVTHIPFGELQTMNNHKPQYLNKPYIFITVPEVVEYYNLGNIYEKVANINKLDSILNCGDAELIKKTVKEIIDVGMRDTAISKIHKMRKEKKLVNIDVINLLKEELKFDIE